MRNSLKMDVLDELRLFREKGLSNSTFCTPVSYSNLNMNLNLKLESETVERIVEFPAFHSQDTIYSRLLHLGYCNQIAFTHRK